MFDVCCVLTVHNILYKKNTKPSYQEFHSMNSSYSRTEIFRCLKRNTYMRMHIVLPWTVYPYMVCPSNMVTYLKAQPFFITFWRRNYFFNFSTSCIQNVNNTGTKYVRIMKQTEFWRGKKRRVYTMFKIFGTYICWINI